MTRTVLKTQLQIGHLNGAIKLCLAAVLAPVGELQFSLTIISPFSMKDRIRIPKADLSFVILKQMEGFSLWLQTTHQMMTTPPFLRVSLATCEIFVVTI